MDISIIPQEKLIQHVFVPFEETEASYSAIPIISP